MVTITLAIITGAAIFGCLWLHVTKNAIRMFGKDPMTFTPDDGNGGIVPFEPRHERYMKIAEVVTTLASASLVFIPGSRLNVYPHSCAFTLVLLGFSVFYCVGFMAMLTYFYEGFLYSRKSYSACRYGLVNALGFGGLFCFGVAYMSLAVRVGWALIYTIPTAGPGKMFP